ncbi:MAG: ABC transporter substrate-binding protein [Actinomycetota bacterium]|jgi:ABC-type transport system substrate-binding protein|nr:ABC transporter substrate-binding protein [Actinomycetota bacterium]
MENSMAGTDIAGTINVVDPHPLNWLYITWNTMEEPVRTDEKGHLSNSAMEGGHWVDDRTFEIKIREGITFQDGTALNSGTFERAFAETQRWKAPHPPGTYLNFDPETQLDVVDDHTVRMRFPAPDGLVLGKFRGFHLPNDRFWDEMGFGYKTLGTGEGHW